MATAFLYRVEDGLSTPFRPRSIVSFGVIFSIALAFFCQPALGEPFQGPDPRRPGSEEDTRYWLENMVWDHGFSTDEIQAATGMSEAEIKAALARFHISPASRPKRPADALLKIRPWPGGRLLSNWEEIERTRQRETKMSVFAPWDPKSYLVLDVPEAIWSSGKLVYLAHVHVPTIWTERNVTLEKLEWNRCPDGALDLTRKLPNGVVYHAIMAPGRDAVRMKLTLTNGTDTLMTGLRVQNCIFLRGLIGFNKPGQRRIVSQPPYAAFGTPDSERWVVTAWLPGGFVWENPRNPCFHSDPTFDDCPPGETRAVYGWLSFYEGKHIEREIDRIDKTGWQKDRWDSRPGTKRD